MTAIYKSNVSFLKYKVIVKYKDGTTDTNPDVIYRKPLKIELKVIDENGILTDSLAGKISNNHHTAIQDWIDVRQVIPFSSNLYSEGSIETTEFTPSPGTIEVNIWGSKKFYFHAEIPVEDPPATSPSSSSSSSSTSNTSQSSDNQTTTPSEGENWKKYVIAALIIIAILYLITKRRRIL